MSSVDTGAVYDRGYRPYDGPRGGRSAATLALYKSSVRRALGIRRSWRQKVVPFVLLGIVTIPAIVNVGVGYVTRTDNRHYKAGNLNHGLQVLRERGVDLEFIALLDADFVAQPQFVRRTLALMHDTKVGIVQTPQCFYNADPHQQAFGGVARWPDEQRSWFGAYLPALDAIGAASCCGTSCLLRVAALEKIGGFPTESVCEDTAKAMRAGTFALIMPVITSALGRWVASTR